MPQEKLSKEQIEGQFNTSWTKMYGIAITG